MSRSQMGDTTPRITQRMGKTFPPSPSVTPDRPEPHRGAKAACRAGLRPFGGLFARRADDESVAARSQNPADSVARRAA